MPAILLPASCQNGDVKSGESYKERAKTLPGVSSVYVARSKFLLVADK